MAVKIRIPPMVGVPALPLWLGGPSSLMCSPTCITLSLRMTHAPQENRRMREVRFARMVLKVM